MNILFITLYDIRDINNSGIYEDLLRKFIANNHDVYIVSPTERRNGEKGHLIETKKCKILKVRTGNIQKTNILEKGMATVLLETQFISGIKKFFGNTKFDLILYSTPPITLAGAVAYIKKRDDARTYLLLKDIFPQNAVDIGIMTKTGLKGLLYRYFRCKEKKLYDLSDYIGCMSQANVEYIRKHNSELNKKCVEICPNCIEPKEISLTLADREEMRKKYEIPIDKIVFVYGGNLGKPQGVPFIIECLKTCKDIQNVFFLIVGAGTEYGKLEEYISIENPDHVKLLSRLPKEDYDWMIAACDIGLIFLDYRFTIPNFPSRLLSYMQAGLPVLSCTDPNTDIGDVVQGAGFGWSCYSNDLKSFKETVYRITTLNLESIEKMKCKEKQYLNEYYTADNGYRIIAERMEIETE